MTATEFEPLPTIWGCSLGCSVPHICTTVENSEPRYLDSEYAIGTELMVAPMEN